MASSQPNTYKLFCIVKGESSPFSVEIQPDKTIDDLKDAIKLKKQPRFNDIAANELTLYKIDLHLLEDPNDPDDEHLEKRVNERLKTEPAPKPLHPIFELLEIYPIDNPPAKRQVHIFVRVPGEQGGNSPRHNNIAKDLEPYIRFKLESLGNYSRADLLNNNIRALETESPPSYIIDFSNKLRRKRPAMAELSTTLDSYLREYHLLISNYFQIPSTTSDVQMTDSTQGTPDKVSYYDWIFLRDILQDPSAFGRNKEAHMYQLIHRLLDLQDARFGRDLIDGLYFNRSWEFPLIVDGARSTDPRKYNPKSDASLWINRFPHLILEIISKPSQSDYYRMLLQAACLARLGNKLRKEKTNPFIVSAIYVDNQLFAKWCLVYQPNEMDNPVGPIEYVEITFNLQTPKDIFKFMFSLYNFIQLAKDADGNLQDTSHRLGEVKDYVTKMKLKGLTTNHRRKTDNDADNRTSNKRRKGDEPADSDVTCDAANLEALDRAGYTIPEEIEGFESLIPLNAKMLKAISADGKEVIVKLTSEHEIEVLRHLHRNQSPKRTRIIPLLDVVDRRLMVLPLRKPLVLFMRLYASPDDIEVLARQFLEGVVYLQDSCVAHLDLKPDNIVVQQDHESKEVNLNIIDFNIAVFADANPTISASNGTDGWHAPEVKRGRPYNPLLADRWSCGRVLEFFADNMKPGQMQETVRLFSQQLMNETPSLRPKVIADLPSLCRLGRKLEHPVQSPVLPPGGAPRLGRGATRSSKRFKGLGMP